jgi:hypothetical protein
MLSWKGLRELHGGDDLLADGLADFTFQSINVPFDLFIKRARRDIVRRGAVDIGMVVKEWVSLLRDFNLALEESFLPSNKFVDLRIDDKEEQFGFDTYDNQKFFLGRRREVAVE